MTNNNFGATLIVLTTIKMKQDKNNFCKSEERERRERERERERLKQKVQF